MKDIQIIRRWLLLFMISLVAAGITALPVQMELEILTRCFSPDTWLGSWLMQVREGWENTNGRYPFLAYGYDWLVFAHLVIAILMIGPYRDPVRNRWVIEWSMICCLLLIPVALLAGYYRGIPLWWRLIDCAFGILGLIPLAFCHSRICKLEEEQYQHTSIQ